LSHSCDFDQRTRRRIVQHEASVVIVGAGPAGARCAELLAAAGHDVLMIEKDSFAGETNVCGGVLDASFASKLDLPTSMIKEINRWVCHFGTRVAEMETRKISFARNRFDRYLAQRAVFRGAELLNSTRAVSAKKESGGISISTLNTKSGERELVRGRIAIFADGPITLAQRFFGIGFRGNPRNMAVGSIYEFEHDGSGDSYELFFDNMVSPWGYGWVVPKPDHLNVGVTCLTAKMDRNIREHCEYLINEDPIVSRQLEGRKKLRYAAAVMPLEPAKALSCNRVMVIGDAAGMVDAIWGGGIKYALRGAECAAKVASEALLQKSWDNGFLARYDLLWKQTRDYAILRRTRLLAKSALPLQTVSRNIYHHIVSLGISHPHLQRLLKIEAENS
jgi:geranylgeranyl reductase